MIKYIKYLIYKLKYKLNQVPRFTNIRIETTNRCGCSCFMCPITKMTRPKGQMSIEQLKIILDKLSYIDYPVSFHLHGHGEALLCKDLPERIKLIRESNAKFNPYIITTFAYNLDREWLESLFKSGLRDFRISLYAYNSESYLKIHGSKNFDYVVQNLKYLSELKDEYSLNFRIELDDFGKNYPEGIVAENQIKEREEFIKFLKSIGLEENIRYLKLHNYGNSNINLPKYEKVIPCSIIWGERKNTLQIDWEGNVIPCCFDFDSKIKFGNIYTQSLKEIFTSNTRWNFLKQHIDCQYIKLCDGCVEYRNQNQEILSKYKKCASWGNIFCNISYTDSHKIIEVLGLKLKFRKDNNV